MLPQTLHNMLDVAGVDVVSLQQAAVAGALHGQLEEAEMLRVKASLRKHGQVETQQLHQQDKLLLAETNVQLIFCGRD